MRSITSSKSRDKAQTLSFGLKKQIKVFINSTRIDTPLFCPVCESIMSHNLDVEAYERVGSCRDCESDFAELNLKDWKNGWRPNQEQIDIKTKEREALALARYLHMEK